MNVPQMQQLAARLRAQTLTMIYRAGGGHAGGSLSALDILVSLYFDVMKHNPADPNAPHRDRFVLSKGHSVEGYYAVLAAAGYFPPAELDDYGRFGTRLYGHPTMKVPGVEAPTGALGHGLPIGVGLALALRSDRVAPAPVAALPATVEPRVFVLMGDGEQAEGSIWEAAMAGAHHGLGNLVAIIDNNRLQISGPVATVMEPSPLAERWQAFGWRVVEVDGHDLSALRAVLQPVGSATGAGTAGTGRPTVVIARTVKGRGVSFMADDVAWHHKVPSLQQLEVALRELIGDQPDFDRFWPLRPVARSAARRAVATRTVAGSIAAAGTLSANATAGTKPSAPSPPAPSSPAAPPSALSATPSLPALSMRHVFTDRLLALARRDPNLVVVTSDARGSVTLGAFAEALPEQFIEVGIAEQNAVGVAAGLARAGKRVFVCGPACFYSARSFEQVKNDIAYAGLNVTIVGVSGGVSYGALGATHHSLHDIAAFRAIPDLSVILPCDNAQMAAVTDYLAGATHPSYVRIGRAAVADLPQSVLPALGLATPSERPPFEWGRARCLRAGGDVALFACGEALYPTLAAARQLAGHGIEAAVIDVATIKPLDVATIVERATAARAVVTVEEHSVHGGLGGAVAEVLGRYCPRPLRIIGFADEWAPAGSSAELFSYYGLTVEGISRVVLEVIHDGRPAV